MGAVLAPSHAIHDDDHALGRPKQRCEAHCKVEAWAAEPVNRAIPPHQRHRLAIADDSIVLYQPGQYRTYLNPRGSTIAELLRHTPPT